MGALFEIYIEPGFFPYGFFYSNLNWKKRMSSNFELIYSNQINPSHVILWLNPKSTNINFDCKIIIFESIDPDLLKRLNFGVKTCLMTSYSKLNLNKWSVSVACPSSTFSLRLIIGW